MNTIFQRILVLFAAALLGSSTATAAPVLIGHKNVAAEKLDVAAVKAIFLGKKVAWDGAGRVVLAVLKSGPVADEFLQGTVAMNASAFNNHWRRLAMTGGGTAPKTFDKEEDLRKFVSETPGAIGFLEAKNTDASVATLTPSP